MNRALSVLLLLLAGLVLSAAAPSAAADLPPLPGDPTTVLPESTFYAGIHWRTEPPAPCPGEVAIAFEFCTCNVTLLGGGRDPAGPVWLHVRIDNRIECIRCAPDTFYVPLGQLAAGDYSVRIEITADFIDAPESLRTEVVSRWFSFAVARDCGPVPPGGLPYVTSIRIGEPSPCIECPPVACPGDSIPVVITGEFPDDCVWLKGVELLPSLVAGPLPEPPVLRILYEWNPCLDRACALTPYPWRATVKLPPLPPRQYSLIVEAARVDACTDSLEMLGRAPWPFVVADSCAPPPPPAPCFATRFAGATPGGVCDAFVGAGQPAELTLTINSGVALAGLQGDLMMYPPGLRIVNLEAVGPAAGMHLTWKPTESGAGFVLFADSGAPIPGDLRCLLSLAARCYAPILRITAALPLGGTAPERTELYAGAMLASDSTGQAVSPCPSVLTDGIVVIDGATICRGEPCDVNADGVSDVRDLVLMVHCVLGAGTCPEPTPPDLDCDRDGAEDIDDVLCCARSLLGGDMPPDTAVARPEPSVVVSLGEPVRTADGADVPVRLAGSDRVGAARLEFTYPTARYDVAGVELAGGSASWLVLHQVLDGRLVVALIDAGGPPSSGAAALDLVVRLTLKPDQQPGGTLALAARELSGPDGVALSVETGNPAQALAVPVRLALSAARPNPFASVTRFTVTLSAPADLEVGVYDLQGRRVASLHRGPAPAGETEFTWDRTRGDGSAVPSGVYFYRAVAEGVTATRKLLVLSRE